MSDLPTAIVTGLLPLAGVVVGALLTPFTQLYIEKKRAQRAASRAKLLVAGELLHIQMGLSTASRLEVWLPVEDVDGFLPTSAWKDNRSSLVGEIDEDLWNSLVMAYSMLQTDRARFVLANRLPAGTPLPPEVAKNFKQTANKLGDLRKELGAQGGWPSETDDELQPKT